MSENSGRTKDLQLDKEVYSAELYILLLKIKNARFHKYIKLQFNYCENSNSLETTDAKLERFFEDFINLILDIQALNEEWEKHRVKRQKVHH